MLWYGIVHVLWVKVRPFEFLMDVIPTIIISGMRNISVGIDTKMYVNLFEELKTVTGFNSFSPYDTQHFGRLFLTFTQLCAHMFNSYHSFLIICSVIALIPLLFFVYKTTDNLFLGFLIFSLMNGLVTSMNIMRQAMAMSVCYLGIYFWTKSKLARSIICFLLGIALHSTTIVLFGVFIISLIPFKKIYILLGGIFGGVLYILYYPIMNIVVMFFPGYSYYLTSAYIQQFSGGQIATFLSILMFLILTIFICYTQEEKEWPDISTQRLKLENTAQWFLVSAMTFSIMTLRFSQATRLSYMFTLILPFIMYDSIQKTHAKRGHLVITIFLFVVLICYYLVIQIFRQQWYGVVPYIFGN